MKTCAFTGHRPKSVDMYAAEIVLELKRSTRRLHWSVPFPMSGRRYGGRKPCGIVTFSIAGHCDQETMLQRQYTPDCLRNRKVGLDSAAGYLGSAIKEASLRWQRGSFFFDRAATPLSQLR